MTREDFEEWLEDHREEILDRIEGDEMSLLKWAILFGKAMIAESKDVDPEETEEDDDGDDNLFEPYEDG